MDSATIATAAVTMTVLSTMWFTAAAQSDDDGASKNDCLFAAVILELRRVLDDGDTLPCNHDVARRLSSMKSISDAAMQLRTIINRFIDPADRLGACEMASRAHVEAVAVMFGVRLCVRHECRSGGDDAVVIFGDTLAPISLFMSLNNEHYTPDASWALYGARVVEACRCELRGGGWNDAVFAIERARRTNAVTLSVS